MYLKLFLGSIVSCDACNPRPRNAPQQVPATAPAGSSPITNDMIQAVEGRGNMKLAQRLRKLQTGDMTELNAEFPNHSGWTTLHAVSYENYPGILEALLKLGADTGIRSKPEDGERTALHLAIYNANLAAVEMFLQHPASKVNYKMTQVTHLCIKQLAQSLWRSLMPCWVFQVSM